MNRQTIIILIAKGKEPEAWGNLKKLCEAKGWKYNTISKMKMPIEIDGSTIIKENVSIYRVPFH
jgi:hypothetical protein